MRNVMLDIETLGTTAGSAITAIGAVQFDKYSIGDACYYQIDVSSSIDKGFSIDGDTLTWWLAQTSEVRKQFALPSMPVAMALELFARWLPKNAVVWGNGSDFDNTLLSAAYRICDMDLPWEWYRNRCYRTIKNICPLTPLNRTGTHHNAKDDAITQAVHLQQCLKWLCIDIEG